MTGKSLAERLSEGRIPPSEGLRYAMNVAEQLRKMHDEGRWHGAVCPANIILNGPSAEVVNTASPEEAQPYSAPEVLEGNAPDGRSDLFGFGAALYEVLTGRKAFAGTDRSTPPSSGSAAVDRLTMPCMSVDPAGRPQRFQKVMVELKMLLVTAQRAAAQPQKPGEGPSAAILRGEMQKLEGRLAERLAANETALAELRQQSAETAPALQLEAQQMESRLGSRLQTFEKLLLEVQKAVSEPREPEPDPVLRFEMQQLDSKVTARLQTNERAMAEMQRIASEALNRESAADYASRPDLLGLEGRLVARLGAHEKATADAQTAALEATTQAAAAVEARTAERMAQQQGWADEAVQSLRRELAEVSARAAEQQRMSDEAVEALRREVAELGARLDEARQQDQAAAVDSAAHARESIEAVSQRLALVEAQGVGGDSARIDQAEGAIEGVRKQISELHDLVADDLLSFEQKLKTQAGAIESARTAMAQTDDLVERVVEALETLQSAVLDQTEERSMALN